MLSFYGTVRRLSSIYIKYLKTSASSQESIKHLTKSELKTELTKRGLPLNSRKDDLLKTYEIY